MTDQPKHRACTKRLTEVNNALRKSIDSIDYAMKTLKQHRNRLENNIAARERYISENVAMSIDSVEADSFLGEEVE